MDRNVSHAWPYGHHMGITFTQICPSQIPCCIAHVGSVWANVDPIVAYPGLPILGPLFLPTYSHILPTLAPHIFFCWLAIMQSWYQFGTNTIWMCIPTWFRQNQQWFYSYILLPKRFSFGIKPIPVLVASDNSHPHQIDSGILVCRYQTRTVRVVKSVSIWCQYDIIMFAGYITYHLSPVWITTSNSIIHIPWRAYSAFVGFCAASTKDCYGKVTAT